MGLPSFLKGESLMHCPTKKLLESPKSSVGKQVTTTQVSRKRMLLNHVNTGNSESSLL